jgi:hypothetical protein
LVKAIVVFANEITTFSWNFFVTLQYNNWRKWKTVKISEFCDAFHLHVHQAIARTSMAQHEHKKDIDSHSHLYENINIYQKSHVVFFLDKNRL